MQHTTNYNLRLYDETDTFDIIGSSNSLNTNMEIIDQALANKNSSFKNLKMMIFGDSICSTHSTITRYTWVHFLPALLGIDIDNIKNYSISNATYVKREGISGVDLKRYPRQWAYNQVADALDESGFQPNIIFVSLGTNDVGAVAKEGLQELKSNKDSFDYAQAMPLDHYVDKGYSDIEYNKLFHHSIQYVLGTLAINFPNAIRFVTTPIQRWDRDQPEWLRDAIEDTAEKNGFIVIDAERESGILRSIELEIDNVNNQPDNNEYQYGLLNRLEKDKVHPNTMGAQHLAHYYTNFIKNTLINL